MSGVKHTPGPWEVRYTDEIYAGSVNIADAWSYDVGTPEQAVANAHLIAAAPDLLEALESIVLMQEENRGDGIKTHLALSHLCVTARAAIDRARGGEA